jgi:REP element-mobilizing transposase RayT
MPQSLSLVIVHLVFSTKDRLPRFEAPLRPHLHAYLAEVARNAGCEAYRVGGVADHVHLAIRLSRTLTIADLVETLKTSSSKWLKTQSAALSDFSWQRLRLLLRRSGGPDGRHDLHRQPGGTSPHPHVSGRVSGVLEQIQRGL